MLHQAWNSKGEMPYRFPRSSVKFQGHTVQSITDFDPNWAFTDYRPVAAFKSLRFALFFSWVTMPRRHDRNRFGSFGPPPTNLCCMMRPDLNLCREISWKCFYTNDIMKWRQCVQLCWTCGLTQRIVKILFYKIETCYKHPKLSISMWLHISINDLTANSVSNWTFAYLNHDAIRPKVSL